MRRHAPTDMAHAFRDSVAGQDAAMHAVADAAL